MYFSMNFLCTQDLEIVSETVGKVRQAARQTFLE